MTQTYSAHLYRQEGTDSRTIYLKVGPEGVRLQATDRGPAVEQMWGDDDYEFWVDVPSDDIRKLVFVLLRERYADRSGSVDEFRALCEKGGIAHKWDNWV